MAVVSRTHNWKRIMLWVLVIIAGIFLLLAVLEKTQVINLLDPNNSSSNGPSEAEKEQEKQTNADTKQSFLDNTYGTDSGNPDSNSQNAANNSASNGSTGTSSITSLSADQNGNSVVVIAKIQSAPGGTCTLTVTNGSSTISKTADIIYQPEFSSCAGFSVPVSEVGAGSWTVKLNVKTTDGSSSSKQITFEAN